MSDELEKYLQQLSDLDGKIIEFAKEMLQIDKLYPVDYLATAVMNRTLSLIDGFVLLARNKNFLAAAHLIRPNLDNYLRFYAVTLVNNPHELADQIMDGEKLKNIKDRDGKKMTDFYLVSCLENDHTWLKQTYEDTSGFIHLSRQHVISALRYNDRDGGVIEAVISREDAFIPDEWKIEATRVMIMATKLTGQLINTWIWAKKNPGKTPDGDL